MIGFAIEGVLLIFIVLCANYGAGFRNSPQMNHLNAYKATTLYQSFKEELKPVPPTITDQRPFTEDTLKILKGTIQLLQKRIKNDQPLTKAESDWFGEAIEIIIKDAKDYINKGALAS